MIFNKQLSIEINQPVSGHFIKRSLGGESAGIYEFSVGLS
jgi:hypothetical protein